MGNCKICNAPFLGNAKTYCVECSYERLLEKRRKQRIKKYGNEETKTGGQEDGSPCSKDW